MATPGRRKLLKREITLSSDGATSLIEATRRALSGMHFPGVVSIAVCIDETAPDPAAIGQAVLDALIGDRIIDGTAAVTDYLVRRDSRVSLGEVRLDLRQTWPLRWRKNQSAVSGKGRRRAAA